MAEKHPELAIGLMNTSVLLLLFLTGKPSILMLSHGYIKNDFDVHKWAAPEFLEKAARELLEIEWKKRTASKLPEATGTLGSGGRIG